MADFQILSWPASRNSHSAKSAAPAQTPSSLLLPTRPSHGFLGGQVRWAAQDPLVVGMFRFNRSGAFRSGEAAPPRSCAPYYSFS
jgi:hypothetical protein